MPTLQSNTMEQLIKKDSIYNYHMDTYALGNTDTYALGTDIMLAYLRKQLQWQAYESAIRVHAQAKLQTIRDDSYLMNCVVILQETPGSCCFGLNVVCYGRENPAFLDEVAPHCIVAKTTFPRHIKKGSIVVRVLSGQFTADVTCGECVNMVKFEHEFAGQSFEKQFACISKGRGIKGLFGKVLLDHVDDAGKCQSIFELNLEKVNSGRESPSPNTVTDTWSSTFMKELAGVLNMSETDDISALMKRLGFTSDEVLSISQSGDDKFHEILIRFRSRGGTPEELLQKLYETKRFSVFEDYVNGTRDCYDVIKEQTSFTSMIPHRGTPYPRDSEEDDGDTIPAEDTCCFSPVKIPTTPPPMVTPLKKSGCPQFHVVKARRLSFEDENASNADTVPVEDLVVEAAPTTPGSRKRCLTEASIGPFSLKRARPSQPETETKTTKNSLEVAMINGEVSSEADVSVEPISPGVLRDIAFQIEDDWKLIGRVLEVPEAHLSCLELAHAGDMDRCLSMLKSWIASEPELDHRKLLHAALVHTGHDIIADKYL